MLTGAKCIGIIILKSFRESDGECLS